jgi:hypothetical protein
MSRLNPMHPSAVVAARPRVGLSCGWRQAGPGSTGARHLSAGYAVFGAGKRLNALLDIIDTPAGGALG